MNYSLQLSIFFLFIVVTSCERIVNKGTELVDKTERKVKEKSNDLIDGVFPQFDAYTPDTKYNKERFNDFLKVELTEDIKNIYCFNDDIGIDADYMFSFNCNEETAKKIIEKHQLTLNKESTNFAFGMQHDFDWWDKTKIEKLDLYSWSNNDQYFKYFWYDKEEQKAYFFDFDM